MKIIGTLYRVELCIRTQMGTTNGRTMASSNKFRFFSQKNIFYGKTISISTPKKDVQHFEINVDLFMTSLILSLTRMQLGKFTLWFQRDILCTSKQSRK